MKIGKFFTCFVGWVVRNYYHFGCKLGYYHCRVEHPPQPKDCSEEESFIFCCFCVIVGSIEYLYRTPRDKLWGDSWFILYL